VIVIEWSKQDIDRSIFCEAEDEKLDFAVNAFKEYPSGAVAENGEYLGSGPQEHRTAVNYVPIAHQTVSLYTEEDLIVDQTYSFY
jgi:hypothetical protein